MTRRSARAMSNSGPHKLSEPVDCDAAAAGGGRSKKRRMDTQQLASQQPESKEEEEAPSVHAEPMHEATQLSEFERRRAEQIARNQAMLLELGVGTAAQQLAELAQARKAAAKQARPPRKPKNSDPTPPMRSSARVRGQGADPALAAGILDEKLRGQILLAQPAPAGPRERHPPGPLPFSSLNAQPGQDEAMITLLRKLHASSEASDSEEEKELSSKAVGKLKLRQKDVAKVRCEARQCVFMWAVEGLKLGFLLGRQVRARAATRAMRTVMRMI